ncbi:MULTISPECIES: sarcosine oxidase subunit alpha family protein [Marivita]|uniref:Sarcosine oxidase subunit alpha family protein n=1 Tax=Marivita cryptomonadis TaxID=505252 RepID=A0ABS2A158_9RHOB|nr:MULTISPECIES: sarcosine oxidase subunit alpha family protein [Marivita]MCR9169043.1 sarcosine oxidase subunit alpha family protein [Paracoccaceae bacterium]MBM2323390.1 sarcosine oxidase subunit alpha family protein [Marivita cryptomonadis]MBM2332976.1 sarcosine oxidase subunit alpha family protein [Marivita cryptomonadis]MBM2342557.1 sarcosine oxidase subunit alpha family protein [Marivita cryptomonadis]MBM2347224.1 sarcosine oxidase subunit alpha family protein [Marivita cryptomonadis]
MTQKNRLDGGLIDRSETYSFRFDSQYYKGHKGDTLASALLANGVRLMGRSFKYHRPRGPMTAGSEEPNAIVELREGARKEPNTRATTAELYDGLRANSQNRWPSLKFDAMQVNDLLSNFFAAGFYYKTFMWPAAFWEKVYEPIIRHAAGLGSLSLQDDPDGYDKGFLHCDLLIIGGGPAGLAAALTAGASGARVILCDEDFLIGGRLNLETYAVGGMSGAAWAAETVARLQAMPNVRVMPRTTVIGAFDHGIYGAVERVSDHLAVPEDGKPRQILWRITSKRALLCAGATERPIVFENNDRPGIMQASAVRAYANRWATTPAEQVAIFTNNDDGHCTASDLVAKGVEVVSVIDTRADAPTSSDYDVIAGGVIDQTWGRLGLSQIEVKMPKGGIRRIKCGALGVSGGWNPNVHLTCHQGGRPVWNEELSAFVPSATLPPGMSVAGAANGVFSTHGALQSGADGVKAILADLGINASAPALPEAEDTPARITPFWHVKNAKRAWVDQQNDVTAKDIKLAHQENYVSVEHLKRYTTLGMATDQGKTSNIAGLAIMAEVAGKAIPEVGTTMFRPPYTPTAMGVFAGRAWGMDTKPTRLTPSHKWAEEQGAVFTEAGLWLRAQWFPQPGETHWRQSCDREVIQTRKSVGICDVTSLGKIDVQGADAAAFLNTVYCNGFAKLPVGKVRYGLMLREDGIVMDDGTAARLAEDHFVVTTTTAKAVPVYRHLEFVRQCLYPDMDVQMISTTDAWAQFAVAGPNSRKLLEKIVDDGVNLSNDAFPFMACGEITICGGLRARLFRISFSGELAYEIAVPTRYGDALVRRLMQAGEEFDVVPYGLEALNVMRIEKGHATANELNGTTTALNLGMGKMVSKAKDSIGSKLSERPGLNEPDALKLVGLKPVDPEHKVPAGAHLMTKGDTVQAKNDQGYVTSACYSPNLGCHIALGFLKSGDTRIGEIIRLVSPLTGVDHDVEVVSPHFVDPEGDRLRA